MRATAHDGDVLRSTDISQTFRNIVRIVVAATRNQNANRRVPRVIRITISGDILAPATRCVDERDCFTRATPNCDGAELDVRDLRRQMTLAPDAYEFVD